MNLKKILAGATVFLLMLPSSVFAASIESAEVNVANDADRTVTVSVTYSEAEENTQATLLVIPSSVALALYQVSDIKYIKQTTAVTNENGAEAEISFSLAEADRNGSYTAYIGGTNIDAPESVTFSFDNNTITIAPTAPDTVNEVTVAVYDQNGNAVGAVPVVEDGKYSYSLEKGVYTVKVTGGAILPYAKTVDISSGSVDIGSIELVSGDVNSDGSVNLTDLESVYSLWLGEGAADINGDGSINLLDIEIIYKNWLKTGDTAY